LLEIKCLSVRFPWNPNLLGRARAWVQAVRNVSFAIQPGETLGVVGESGSGKTTLARAIVGLAKPTQGEIWFDGKQLHQKRTATDRAWRSSLQMIFQDPFGSLDPRLTIEDSVAEGLDIHRRTRTSSQRRATVLKSLSEVGLNEEHSQRLPHELSGGQRQRVGIARALVLQPKLLVCDEAVSALDVSVQAQIVNLLKDLQSRRGIAYLFISHDLAVVAHLSRRIMVMYCGEVVEIGAAREVTDRPLHPYTRALVAAVPVLDVSRSRTRILLPGEIPLPLEPPSGCPFHLRCPIANAGRCRTEVPSLREIGPGRWVACHLA